MEICIWLTEYLEELHRLREIEEELVAAILRSQARRGLRGGV